jgi:hypothetical protein
VYPGFLAPILLSSGVRRAFTLLCDPVRADQAARDIRKKKTGYLSDATQRARIGQRDIERNPLMANERSGGAGHANAKRRTAPPSR